MVQDPLYCACFNGSHKNGPPHWGRVEKCCVVLVWTHFHCRNLSVRMAGNQQQDSLTQNWWKFCHKELSMCSTLKSIDGDKKIFTKHFVKKKPWSCVEEAFGQLHCFAVWSAQIKLSGFTQRLKQNHWKRGLENRCGSLELIRHLLLVHTSWATGLVGDHLKPLVQRLFWAIIKAKNWKVSEIHDDAQFNSFVIWHSSPAS